MRSKMTLTKETFYNMTDDCKSKINRSVFNNLSF